MDSVGFFEIVCLMVPGLIKAVFNGISEFLEVPELSIIELNESME